MGRTLPWVAHGELIAAWGLLALLVIGLVPWRRWGPRMLARVRRRAGTPVAAPASGEPQAPWWWVALWIALPAAALALTWLPKDSAWYHAIWGDRSITKIWEPRYLGIIVPAWILWLAVALRRLPTRPLRVAVVGAVVAVSLAAALPNYLVYRQAPFGHIADVYARYAHDAGGTDTVGLAMPRRRWDVTHEDMDTLRIALDKPPTSPRGDAPLPWRNLRSGLEDGRLLPAARSLAHNDQLRTLVLVDRQGDQNDEFLGDAAIQEALGANWHLTHSETFGWYYEWHYYFLNPWRLRVWQRTPDAPATPAAPAAR